ncbi:uncharacterized protein LOC121239768 [Juglans microcarpa x Juglans regia]|uniref:uncharacterized protein LOC121239768 n=1 Tax=Juglans microcarpa x Juglans regia TaxID=2249226 RepID=UPI001B7E2EEC|nr:uncharacterized protein LOC121239768 [Juglans microcarpa x Juglans regia]
MSLVDYGSSSDDDVSDAEEEEPRDEPEQGPKDIPHRPVLPQNRVSETPSNQQPDSSAAHSSEPSIERLPDASLLLNLPAIASGLMSSSDHSSRVAAAMAENASRKRDSNDSTLTSSLPRSKVPRGTLRHSRNVPDTVGGVLVPPQLSGRSNVVTEDIGKLFVRKHAEPSSQ